MRATDPTGAEAVAETDVGKAQVRFWVGLVAFLAGLAAASFYEDVRILQAFRPDASPAVWLDVLTTGLVVSGGTEGLNSFLKFLGYTKEKKESEKEALSAQAELAKVQASQLQ